MYTKLIVNRHEVKITSMSKMNVKQGKREKSHIAVISDEERERRYYYNQLKKRRMIIDIISINFKENCSCFVTLTFADETISIKKATDMFEKFTKNMRKIYFNFKYVTTVEFQDKGKIHYHLICNIPDEEDALDSVLNNWNSREINVQIVYDIKGLAIYMTKEFLEQNRISPLFGKRGYKTSHDLDKQFNFNSWSMGKEKFEALKNALITGEPKGVTSMYHECAGDIVYSTHELAVDSNTIFGEYVLATRKK